MTLDELLRMIDLRWRSALRQLVEEGEASEEFLEYLEKSPECEAVLDAALALQATRIESLHDAIQSVSERSNDSRDGVLTRIGRQLRDAFAASRSLRASDQKRVFDEALRELDSEEIDRLAQLVDTQRYATRRVSA